MPFPDISPIAFEIGPLVVRWYALAYVAGILLGQRYLIWLDNRNATPIFSKQAREDVILYAVIGIILGGRFGYVVFYNWSYYQHNLHEVLYLWHGGMSFHGGLIGCLVAFWLFARRFHIPWLRVMDYVAVVTPIGLCLGRLANFVNGELYGRVTSVAWGMVFPNGGDLPRHPSQLYQAGLEGLALGLLLFFLAIRTNARAQIGLLSGVFAIGYACARFAVEFFREPDRQLGLLSLGLTMGQWLCVPLAIAGVWAITSARKQVTTRR
jgi:phosphatidylglycerol---prolipoprotein diacylglyceryl transferase